METGKGKPRIDAVRNEAINVVVDLAELTGLGKAPATASAASKK